MKGMIYRDGKFISVLTDTDTNSLYAELPRNKKQKAKATTVKKKKAQESKKQ